MYRQLTNSTANFYNKNKMIKCFGKYEVDFIHIDYANIISIKYKCCKFYQIIGRSFLHKELF